MLSKRPWHAHSVVTCCNIIRDGLRTVRKTESSNNFPFFQPDDLRRVWLVRLAKAETMQCYMAQRAERVDDHACKTLSSGLREASCWSKNGLRSNLIASKFQKFSGGGGGGGGGACPQTPLAVARLRTHHSPDHSKFDSYGPV